MKPIFGVTFILSFFLNSCAAIKADIDHSGGTVGYYADYVIPGESKQIELYRAAFAFAFLSRLGAVAIDDRNEARAFLFRMQAVSDDLNRLGGHLDSTVPDCDQLSKANMDCTQLFEQDVPSLEGHLFKLAIASVPQDQLDDIWDELKSGSYIAAAWKLAQLSGQEVVAAHNGVAVWRSEREVFASILAAGGRSECKNTNTVDDAVGCIDKVGKSKGKDSPHPFADAFGVAKKNSDANTNIGPIYAFYDVVQESCLQLKAVANGPQTTEASEATVLNCGFAYEPKANDYADHAGEPAGNGVPKTQPQSQPMASKPQTQAAAITLGVPQSHPDAQPGSQPVIAPKPGRKDKKAASRKTESHQTG